MALSDLIDFLKLRGKQKSNTLGNKAKYDMMEDTTDVFKGYLYYKNFLTEKLIKIFKYEGLPYTIPQEALEDYILHFGFAGITKNENFGMVAVPCTKYGVGLYPRYEPFAQYCTPLMQGRDLIVGRDIVIVKKSKDYDNMSIGDVIAYEYHNVLVVHRISNKTKVDDEYYFYSKGDSNDNEDNYIIKQDMIEGIVKFRIPFIGMPTVWLNELWEE